MRGSMLREREREVRPRAVLSLRREINENPQQRADLSSRHAGSHYAAGIAPEELSIVF